MVWASHLEKLLEVVVGLPCLALEITLGGNDTFLIRVVSLVVIIILVAAGSTYDTLRGLLPTTFGASLSTFAGGLGYRTLATGGGCLLIALDKNGFDYLNTRGMPGGNVK
jgi:hypothetical protein